MIGATLQHKILAINKETAKWKPFEEDNLFDDNAMDVMQIKEWNN